MNIQIKASWLKLAKLMTIIGWCLMIFGIGTFFIVMASWLLFCVLVAREKIAKSILILFFNGLTLGIWGFFAGRNEFREVEAAMQNGTPEPTPSYASLFEGYKVARILGLVAICIPFFGWFIIAPIAGVFTGVQEARQKRFGYAVFLMAFNTWTLGIWGFVVANKRKKQFAILKDQPQPVESAPTPENDDQFASANDELATNNVTTIETASYSEVHEEINEINETNEATEVKQLEAPKPPVASGPKFEYNEHQE